MLGGDTLQELRICLNLTESEREGGVSTMVSPLMNITDIGNILARAKLNLPTIDITHTQYEFTNAFQLMDFLRQTGEQNALFSRRRFVSHETFIAAAAIYQTLFNKTTIGQRDETSTSVLIDTFANIPFSNDDQVKIDRSKNIIATFDSIFLIGWKYHES